MHLIFLLQQTNINIKKRIVNILYINTFFESLKDIQHSDITFDEKGMTAYWRQKHKEIEFVNRYYSTKGNKG